MHLYAFIYNRKQKRTTTKVDFFCGVACVHIYIHILYIHIYIYNKIPN
jgi:hypothetical protein